VFGVVKFSEGTARKAAEVKAAGDEILKRAPDPSLRARRLSACDAFTIAVALDTGFYQCSAGIRIWCT
jgi:hypothetical protein